MRLLHACSGRPERNVVVNAAGEKAAQKVLVSGASGSRHLTVVTTTIGLTLGTSLLLALAPGVANASPPVGTCTSSYTELTYAQVGMLPDGALAQSAFNVVNANGDAYVCYKPYPNGPHNGHYGNFVDNTAAPHQ
jgi:hypothetical protein